MVAGKSDLMGLLVRTSYSVKFYITHIDCESGACTELVSMNLRVS
jgi:hypothetical protein